MGRWLQGFGVLWVGLGLLVPASVLIEAAAVTDPARMGALELGATLHKGFAVLLGLSAIGVGWLIRRARPPEGEAPALVYGTPRERLGLLGLLLAAFGIRVISLEGGLWYDEIVTLVEFVRLPLEQLALTYTSLNNHMLFSISARLSVVLFGESGWALRLPAVCFGVASIAATWWLAIQVVPKRQAFLVAGLMAVSYHHVWFSQNARGYTGLLFFTIVATTLFLEGMRRHGRALWLAYAVVFALAMYVHLSAVFAFLAHALVWGVLFLWRRIPALRARLGPQDNLPGAGEWWPLLGFAFGSVIILQLNGILFPQMVAVYETKMAAQTKGGIAQWQNPLWTLFEVIRVLAVNPVMAVGIPVGGALMAVGFVRIFKKNPLLATLLVVHVPLTATILIAIEFHIWPRYFLVDMGFFLIILVHGAVGLSGWLGDKLGLTARGWTAERLGTAAVAVMILVSALTVPRNYQLPKQDYEGAIAYVEAQRGPGDAVVTAGIIEDPLEDYFDRHYPKVEDDKELAAAKVDGATTWLLATFPAQLRSHHPGVVEVLDKDFELAQAFPGTLNGGEVLVYRSRTDR